ncbi:ABC transporter substrate-binding protein [Clostridium sp. YIM B02551]|uniref:ABC transporter substrate-binding protein n=1 Tax=Clostridium sp. YIM B02551 TaxID=2910679 RepID=UPI001EEB16C3|nr:extracellular solute-binding protein [Clostridium sp. YIM B02551]
MRKNLQKIIAIGLMLSVVGITGCAKSKPTSTDSKGQVTVKLGIWPQDGLTDQIEQHKKWAAQILESDNVKIEPAYYKYAVDSFVSMATAGNAPTIFDTWYTEPQKLIDNGFVRDITPQLKELGWDTKMNPDVMKLLSKDGKIYGLPRDGYAEGLMINAKLFKDAGLADANGKPIYPKTWDELAQDAKIIKEKTGHAGIDILAKDAAGGWLFTNIAWDFGAQFEVQKDGKWTAQLNSKEAIAAMQYVKDLKWKYDVLTADPTNEDWASGYKAIATEDAAMYIASPDSADQLALNKMDIKNLSMAPLPAGPDGKQYALSGGTPYMFAANATDDQVKAALKYLVLMGKAPVTTDDSIKGLEADAQARVAKGVPILPSFPAWTDPDYLKAQADAQKKYLNVDMSLYNDYYDWIKKPGVLHLEEPVATQDLYKELTNVLQAVLTDKNADVSQLLNKANTNFQTVLDNTK